MIGKVRKIKGIPQLLHYVENGQGEAIVMLHGVLVDASMYDKLVSYLEPYYRCILPDLRAHGKSKKFNKHLSIKLQAKDVKLLLDHLGIRKAHIVGYSMGGLIAQEFCFQFPERVKTLSLLCTFTYKGLNPIEQVQNKLFLEFIETFGSKGLSRIINSYVAGGEPMDYETLRWYKQQIRKVDKETLLKLFKQIFAFDGRAKIRNIKCPTLIMGAKQDLITPFHHSEYLHQNIPNSKFVAIPEAGHNAIYSHPEFIARELLLFLQQHRCEECTTEKKKTNESIGTAC